MKDSFFSDQRDSPRYVRLANHKYVMAVGIALSPKKTEQEETEEENKKL